MYVYGVVHKGLQKLTVVKLDMIGGDGPRLKVSYNIL